MIKLKNVTKIYKGDLFETVALKDVTLTVQEGEFVAIMGESGSGKTTLLNILGGMDRVTSGNYYLRDIAVHDCTPDKLDRLRREYISFIFQHFALMDEFSIYENIEAPLLARNIKKADRKHRIIDAVEKLNISDLLDKYPTQISGGQRQRVSLARALVTNCPIILADEPTGALDEQNTKNVMEQFVLLHKQKKTILVITHDHKVAEYAERVVVIKDGRMV